jgi:periplasmic divalent cation tolerance protein
MVEHYYEYASKTGVCVALSTCPDEAVAARIAHRVVEDGLAACVTRIPGATSVYRWQGRVEDDAEVQLVIKTSRARVAALQSALRGLHPFEEPEFLVLDASGARGYVNWIVEETAEATE